MRLASLVFVSFLAWHLAACTHAPLGAGEKRWLLLESKHFSLYTDLRRDRAIEEVRSMERLFAGLEQSGWERSKGSSELQLRLNVVMFANASDLDRYVRDDIIAYHIPDVLYEPWIVVPGDGVRDERLQTVAHELTHYMADAAMPRQPLWFAEGLASYFETGHFEEDGRFVLGSVPEGRFQELIAFGLLRPSALLSGEITRDDHRFYSSSWLLVHYLMNEKGYAFQEYQKGLLRGFSYERAWQDAFPQPSPELLDKAVEEYVLRGTYARFKMPIEEPVIMAPRERVLSRADEHALQAILWIANMRENPQDEQRARQAVALALADDADHLLAGALKVSFTQPENPQRAVSQAKRLFERHPQQWLAAALLGEAAWKVGEELPLGGPHDVMRTAALAPWQPQSWLVRAEQEALRGERAKANVSAKRARDMQPAKLEVLWSYADIMMRMGECGPIPELVGLLESHKLSDEERKALAHMRAECKLDGSALSTGQVPH